MKKTIVYKGITFYFDGDDDRELIAAHIVGKHSGYVFGSEDFLNEVSKLYETLKTL